MAGSTFVGFFRPSLYQQTRLSINNSNRFDKSKQLGLLINNASRVRAKASSSASFEGYGGVSSQPQPNIPLYTWPHKKRPRVCILGGGFGGLYTALRLESLEWPDDKKPQVILVDQSERFVFKPLLYELLSGEVDTWEIAPRFTDLLGSTNVRFLKDRVKSLFPSDNYRLASPPTFGSAGTVHLESGVRVEYDWYRSEDMT
ncbi:hypothetical protein LIER_34356 [Lithospermum erythrorhizon]|uniref:FAD/NAD(P)-binding domain-containing protein n=1 Tax=Lithospermum erythrorhizon TaxID=34254 RepID=A0AAV3RZF4_LITER